MSCVCKILIPKLCKGWPHYIMFLHTVIVVPIILPVVVLEASKYEVTTILNSLLVYPG